MSQHQARRAWLITGASRGLGREIARAVLARGDLVVGTSRDGSSDLVPGAGELHMLPLDLASPGLEREILERAMRVRGRLDVLVNNAGYGLLGAVEEADDLEAKRVFDVNFFGPLRLIRAILPIFRNQGHGCIVNVSSIAGFAPAAGSGLYAASKFALEGLSESLAQEVTPLGVRVMLVEPGAFRTDFLSSRSIQHATARVDAYTETSGRAIEYLRRLAGNQIGDPSRGAAAILEAIDSTEPPLHLFLGSDSVRRAREQLKRLGEMIDRWKGLSLGTDFRTHSGA
ncbi:SDR family NAD(P)-dependent oxidoreductase [Aquisphaera insulae]|uniref:SDR family NAD(P)-dependent oxidoreductase n=1 Tax=Aquisphaera insulae TaxID=2712864 RepID=UPI0013EDF542|nr:SDR family NAD(P)-dependent oxidoreductase [Aquisphaera insulae]